MTSEESDYCAERYARGEYDHSAEWDNWKETHAAWQQRCKEMEEHHEMVDSIAASYGSYPSGYEWMAKERGELLDAEPKEPNKYEIGHFEHVWLRQNHAELLRFHTWPSPAKVIFVRFRNAWLNMLRRP